MITHNCEDGKYMITIMILCHNSVQEVNYDRSNVQVVKLWSLSCNYSCRDSKRSTLTTQKSIFSTQSLVEILLTPSVCAYPSYLKGYLPYL